MKVAEVRNIQGFQSKGALDLQGAESITPFDAGFEGPSKFVWYHEDANPKDGNERRIKHNDLKLHKNGRELVVSPLQWKFSTNTPSTSTMSRSTEYGCSYHAYNRKLLAQFERLAAESGG
jgi:hypothetical protein